MWLGIMLATYLAGLVMGAWQNYLLERTGQAFVRNIRKELFAKFQYQSLGYHHDHSTGDLFARMTGDVDAIEQSVLQGLTTLLEEMVTFIVVAAAEPDPHDRPDERHPAAGPGLSAAGDGTARRAGWD
jgi:ATP-binding cassette subfamily B protein